MTLKTLPLDEAELLGTPDAMAEFLRLSFESGDEAEIRDSIGIVARAKGMTEIARQAGVSRESLYRSFSEGGNPALATVEKVLFTLGLQLTVKPIAKPKPDKPKRARKARVREEAHA